MKKTFKLLVFVECDDLATARKISEEILEDVNEAVKVQIFDPELAAQQCQLNLPPS